MRCESLLSTKGSKSNIQVGSIVDYAPSDSIAAKNGTSKVLSIRPLGWHAHGVRVPSQRPIVRDARIQLLDSFPAFLAEARIPLSPLQAMSKKKHLPCRIPHIISEQHCLQGGKGGTFAGCSCRGVGEKVCAGSPMDEKATRGTGENACWVAYGAIWGEGKSACWVVPAGFGVCVCEVRVGERKLVWCARVCV